MLQRRKETILSLLCDRPEWHRGRSEYAVWLIELAGDDVLESIEAARRHLSEFLLPSYLRQPHITLFVCGFPTGTPRYDDDYGMKTFDAQLQALHDSKIGQFSIIVGNLNSFASAPFLEVEDSEGGIERLRTVLSLSAAEIGRDGFTPHVTVGLYSGVFCGGLVGRKIATFPSRKLTVTIDRITFATYQAQVLAGLLTNKREVVLQSQVREGRDAFG